MNDENTNLRNYPENVNIVQNKLLMSFNAKEFVPKIKSTNEDVIANNNNNQYCGENDDEIDDERTLLIKDHINTDTENAFIIDYEQNLNCGLNEEVEANFNGAHGRPTSLEVSALTDGGLYHSLPLHNPALYTLEPAGASYGLYGAQAASMGYTQEHIEYVTPSVFQTSPLSPVIVQQTVPTAMGVYQSYSNNNNNSEGSSPHSFQSVSPPIITGTNKGLTTTSNGGEHYVMVHVNLGETFSIRVGDQIQNISGPATVRMVSNSGPPTPMPMQVPPGHMVQQIVDENGILTHVILSPLHQPTQCLGPHGQHMHVSNQQSSFYPSCQNSGTVPMYSNNFNVYTNGSNVSQTQNVYNSQDVIEENNTDINLAVSSDQNNRLNKEQNNHTEFNSSSHNNIRSLNNYAEGKSRSMKSRGHQYRHTSQTDDPNHYLKSRTSQMVSSLGNDVSSTNPNHNQEKSVNNSGYTNHTHYSKIRKKRPFTNSATANTKHHYIQDQVSSPASSADEATTILTDEEKKAIQDVLNTMEQPKVSEIEARSALIHITAPTIPDNCVATLNSVDFTFQLYFAERNPDSRYNCVFYGKHVEISLQDLKPATVYYVKVCSIYENITGNLSLPNKFTTSGAEPNTPKPVQLQAKTRNSIQLKWSSPTENGSKITEYIVEYCAADSSNENYISGYRGNTKLCKISKLKPSTEYLFRLAAINSFGQSPWSDSMSVTTSGTAPLPPDPPTVARADIGGLLLTWKKRPTDETFCLEMMDEATGYGFITVFNGPEVEHYVENLRRNTSYRFHLAASNLDGRSKWSEVVTISTKPDLPSSPQKLHIRGKVNPTQFVLVWDPPEDDGGLPVTSYKLEMDVTTADITDSDSDRDWVLYYEGLEREYQCKSLIPGSSVLARVSAKSSNGGWGNPCPHITIHLGALPPSQMMPPRKDIGNKNKGGLFTAGSINLLWEKSENDGGASIINYELCQWLLKTKSKVSQTSNSGCNVVLEEYLEECEEQMVYNGTQLHCQISGLIPGAQYRYRIRATNKAGNSKWSNHLDATSGPSAPEGPSEAPTALSRSIHSAIVSWLPPKQENGSQIIEYRLEMKFTSDINGEFQLIYSGQNLSYEVKNLLPFSCYQFRVQSVNIAGVSPYSPVCEFITPPSAPSQVMNLRTGVITMHSITLLWKEPASHGSTINNYLIEVTNSNASSMISSHSTEFTNNHNNLLQGLFTLSSDTTDKVIGDLLPDTNYKFRVQAINNVGAGPFSAIVKASTLSPPPAPPRLDCLNVQSNSIKLRWHNDVSARQYYINRLFASLNPLDKSSSINLPQTLNELPITQYQLQMSRHRDTGWSNVYVGSLQFHKLGKLLESTNYYFRIMASNEIGDGDFSEPYPIVTQKAAPPPVRAPKITDMTMDSCSIEWPAIRSMNFDPIVYILQLLTISEKDCDYRQLWKYGVEVFRGSDTTCRLTNLTPGTEYMTRVCAVRLCSPSTIEPVKLADSPIHFQKNIHEIGKVGKLSAKLKDNSSPVTELLGAFSKSVAFTTMSNNNPARCNNGNITTSINSVENCGKVFGSRFSRKVQLPLFISHWLDSIGPWTDKHFIMFVLFLFTVTVVIIAKILQSYL